MNKNEYTEKEKLEWYKEFITSYDELKEYCTSHKDCKKRKTPMNCNCKYMKNHLKILNRVFEK